MHHSPVTVEQKHLIAALRQWSIAVVLCGLVFGIDRIGAVSWLRGGLERGMFVIDSRVVRFESFVKKPFFWVVKAKDSSQRLADLEERLARASVQQQRMEEMEARLQTLEPLVIKTTGGKKAEFIGQLVDYGDRVMLAAGIQSGVTVGQVMTDKEGVLVGQIEKVGRYMSEVGLLDETGSRVQVQTINGSTRGIIEGKGGYSELVGVLQTELLEEGDVLVTSGTDGAYPPGLVVGQVISLTGKPEDVTKGGVVELLAQRSGWVAVW